MVWLPSNTAEKANFDAEFRMPAAGFGGGGSDLTEEQAAELTEAFAMFGSADADGGKMDLPEFLSTEAARMRDLAAEDRLVLQEIEKSGVSAISTKELRFRAGGITPVALNRLRAALGR